MIAIDGLRTEELKYRGKSLGLYRYYDNTGTIVAKNCTKCFEPLQLSSFYPQSRSKDGYAPRCKDCAQSTLGNWRENNPDKVKSGYNRVIAKRKTRSDEQLLDDQIILHPDGNKTCKTCSISKPLQDYSVNRRTRDGLSKLCRSCDGVRTTAWAKDNPEKTKLIDNKHREKNKSRSFSEIINEISIRYPEGTKTCKSCKKDVSVDLYYLSVGRSDPTESRCIPCQSIHYKEWYHKANIDHWAAMSVPVVCYMCGGDFEHADHVIPLALEGPDTLQNQLPACANHNLSKSDTPLEIFVQSFENPAAILDRVESYGVSYKV